MKVQIELNELIDLLWSRNRLDALERSGVDNWTWYDESRPDISYDDFVEEQRQLYGQYEGQGS